MRIAIVLALCLQACTTYTEDGELVRHHFGYVRVITPTIHAPDGPVQAIGVSNYGLWFDIDKRKIDQRTGSGGGIGFRSDWQNILPETCRIIFRVTTKAEFEASAELVRELKKGGQDICAIKEESL